MDIYLLKHTHANIRINYQSIGSGGGVEQVKNGTVDFGASDAPLNNDQLKGMRPVIQIPESAGPVCITYSLPTLNKPVQLSAEAIAGIYLGKITSCVIPSFCATTLESTSSQHQHRRNPPYRRQRHHQRLHDLSLRRQPRVAAESWRRKRCRLARRPRWQRKRGRHRAGSPISWCHRLRRTHLRPAEHTSCRRGQKPRWPIHPAQHVQHDSRHRCLHQISLQRIPGPPL